MTAPVLKSLISESHIVRFPSDRCRACGGKLVLTGTKMNPETFGRRRERANLQRAGYDELVVCADCGWVWWVHRA